MAASGSVSSFTPIAKMLTPVAMYLTAAESTRGFCRVPRSLGKFTLTGALTKRNRRPPNKLFPPAAATPKVQVISGENLQRE
jgi:hypothetical protein